MKINEIEILKYMCVCKEVGVKLRTMILFSIRLTLNNFAKNFVETLYKFCCLYMNVSRPRPMCLLLLMS